ncbi:exodeoxyribonuclease V subunit alpha [Dermatobacter hominis]|uniref:exodeoxyribonuclease V subunit alpha n=1 Tax=Dermatobacter hominis TaxID=2884263 RepID=UPI001D11BCDF|nr:exodeoxyribonuclease V subunit alpha [Dermatobacter hominis]UDY34765.1 exodeoxyribonuclease V subunit alpha [Dermatobacter hominis]
MTRRFLPASVECLRPFVDAGVLGMTEVHVVATFVEVLDPGLAPPDDVVLAAALAVRGPLHGHVRIDLTEVAGSVVPDERDDGPSAPAADLEGRDDEGPDLDLPALDVDAAPVDPDVTSDGVTALPWPEPERWARRVLDSALARAEDDDPGDLVPPLVVDGSQVYLDRYWRDERAVADDLRRRAGRRTDAEPGRLAALDRFLPPSTGPTPDLQRVAARAALERQLVVIAGGPGTGKTRTVSRLLAVLASDGRGEGGRLDGRSLEIALAAPTGKAAARLEEAINAAVRDADPDPEVAARLGALEAQTVHRLLGARRGGASFTRDASNPIAADVVVVDEVSMVSLPLMARLLEAVRPDARVVLVGDPHQLASVEAGAVLGDLVGGDGGKPPDAIADNVVTLEQVFRFGAESPVGALAAAIRSGDADAVLDHLVRSPTSSEAPEEEFVCWVRPDDPAAVDGVRSQVLGHAVDLVDLAREGRTTSALRSLGAVKVLSATRRGELGADDWNRRVEQELRTTGRMRERWSAGRPVMVTANDYLNGVFNGDLGVVVRPADVGDRAPRVQVAFDGVDGPRLLDPSRLDRVETQWAMTIHKSQGSEFDDVVVAMPPPPSPILTRELLYTAVTRARRGVTIVASEASIRAAVGRPVTRSSGLADRLA